MSCGSEFQTKKYTTRPHNQEVYYYTNYEALQARSVPLRKLQSLPAKECTITQTTRPSAKKRTTAQTTRPPNQEVYHYTNYEASQPRSVPLRVPLHKVRGFQAKKCTITQTMRP